MEKNIRNEFKRRMNRDREEERGGLGMAKNIRRLYLEVTQDEYELPLKVANSPEELAKMCGTTKAAVCSAISHYKAGRRKKTRFRSVPYYEEDLDG